MGLRGHRQLVLEGHNTKVTRVWEWSTGLREGLGRAAHRVGNMVAGGAGGTDSLFSRCASLTRPGGAWDETEEDGARNARDYWWQGWKGKWWELTNDLPWVKLQVPVKVEGIAAAARSWSTMPNAAALLAKKVADADRAKQQAAAKKTTGGEGQPSCMGAGEDGSGDTQRTPPMANQENSANGGGSALVVEDE